MQNILESLGFRLTDDGVRFWRTAAIYRSGDNSTALRISKKNGSFIDFVQNTAGPFYKLIQLSLGLQKPKEAKEWLSNKKFVPKIAEQEAPKIVMPEFFDVKMLDRLIKNHEYWTKRGIKNEIVEQFRGGIATEGRMTNRYVFPIFDIHERIAGFTGRDLTGKSPMKYKHIGEKTKWVWPMQLNRDILVESKQVIIVESPACVLKLFQNNIKNVLCLWGTQLSDSLLCALVGVFPKQIIIATNNEASQIGNNAAIKIQKRLERFFDKNKIFIFLPYSKDFAEMNDEDIQKWRADLNEKTLEKQ